MAAKRLAGAFGLKGRVDAENEIGHLRFAGIVGAGAQSSRRMLASNGACDVGRRLLVASFVR